MFFFCCLRIASIMCNRAMGQEHSYLPQLYGFLILFLYLFAPVVWFIPIFCPSCMVYSDWQPNSLPLLFSLLLFFFFPFFYIFFFPLTHCSYIVVIERGKGTSSGDGRGAKICGSRQRNWNGWESFVRNRLWIPRLLVRLLFLLLISYGLIFLRSFTLGVAGRSGGGCKERRRCKCEKESYSDVLLSLSFLLFLELTLLFHFAFIFVFFPRPFERFYLLEPDYPERVLPDEACGAQRPSILSLSYTLRH